MPTKQSNLLIRLTKQEHLACKIKANLLNTSISCLARDGIKAFWPRSFDEDAQDIYNLYSQSDKQDKQDVVNTISDFLLTNGYPHRYLNPEQLQKGMVTLSKTKCPLLPDDHLQTNTVGLPIANFFHPHMVNVKCGRHRTPYEQFSDPDMLKDAIARWMQLGKKPSYSGLRRILKTRDGVRSVVNFKPAIAQYIYKTYCPVDGSALDPCSGYGGRLAGCISTNRNIYYHGIDPHGPTAVGNVKLAAEFEPSWEFGFGFNLGCAEDIMPALPESSYDLVFTSPPYFNTERYSNAKTQSWVRYPEYNRWRDEFLKVIIEESRRVLKPGRHFILNVKNYKHAPIADDLLSIAKKVDFSLIKRYNMKLPNVDYKLSSKDTWHTEPIFVFIK